MPSKWALLLSASLGGIACITDASPLATPCSPVAQNGRHSEAEPGALKRAVAKDPIPGQLSWFELEFNPADLHDGAAPPSGRPSPSISTTSSSSPSPCNHGGRRYQEKHARFAEIVARNMKR